MVGTAMTGTLGEPLLRLVVFSLAFGKPYLYSVMRLVTGG